MMLTKNISKMLCRNCKYFDPDHDDGQRRNIAVSDQFNGLGLCHRIPTIHARHKIDDDGLVINPEHIDTGAFNQGAYGVGQASRDQKTLYVDPDKFFCAHFEGEKSDAA